jgi:hypothetical protein
MIRKLALAFAAVAALGTAALTGSTTPAAARHGWHGHHHHHHHHRGWHRPGYRVYGPAFAYTGCYVKRVVGTPWGPRMRWVNVCY